MTEAIVLAADHAGFELKRGLAALFDTPFAGTAHGVRFATMG